MPRIQLLVRTPRTAWSETKTEGVIKSRSGSERSHRPASARAATISAARFVFQSEESLIELSVRLELGDELEDLRKGAQRAAQDLGYRYASMVPRVALATARSLSTASR